MKLPVKPLSFIPLLSEMTFLNVFLSEYSIYFQMACTLMKVIKLLSLQFYLILRWILETLFFMDCGI